MSVKGFLDDYYEKQRQAFYSHVRPWIVIGVEMAKATGWRMSYEQYTALIDFLGGMNSYERRILVPLLDDLGVCAITEYNMSQYRTLSELVYDEAVQRELAPLLVKRLREASTRADKFKVHRDTLLEGGCDQVEELTAMSARVAFAEKQFTKAGADNERLNRELLTARKQAREWEHLKKSVAGQQKRADKAESEHLLVQKDLFKAWEERDAARSEAEAWRKRAAEWETKQHFAQKQAAIWEIEAQDLRDRLVQVETALTHNTIACVR